jgi:hypothetical protein
LISVMVAVPVAINVMAIGQTTTTQEAAVIIQAKQAAAAGVSDYINHLQAYNLAHSGSSYSQYCSAGVSSFGCAGPRDTTNPAFVTSDATTGGWFTNGVTMPAAVNGGASYRYVVGAPDASVPQHVTIFSIGQAGTQNGQHAIYTDEAALTVCAAGCLSPVTTASCIKVPTNAVSAQIVAYGAKGGGTGVQVGLLKDSDALGGVGAKVTATVPVTQGHILELVPGQPGAPGSPQLASLLGIPILFAGSGGSGGSTALGTCSPVPPNAPPDLSGGNGAIPGGLVDAVNDGGGGGGGATMIFDATTGGSAGMVAVAGGGGGGGAGDLLSGLLGDAGPGGSAGTAPPGDGVNAGGAFPGQKGKGGVWNNPTGAGLCAAISFGGAKTASGNGCGQDGNVGGLSGVLTVLAGGGGGGGGGYNGPSLGGGGGGTSGGLLNVLLGAGAGGGAGYSYANNGTCAAPVVVPATTYPTGDTTGTGQISINFFGGPCGTTPLTTVTGTIRTASAP